MNRAITKRTLLLASASTVGTLGLVPYPAQAALTAQPNIIFFLADDMGVTDASCYGAPQIRTPAIDQIATDGVRFTQAYANSAVCTASRTALITGRYQDRFQIGLQEPLTTSKLVGLSPKTPTLPSQLKRAGYVTTLLGKWHLGVMPTFGPQLSGYDHFWGFRGGALDYFSHRNQDGPDLWDGPTPIEEHGYLTDMIGDRAVNLVRSHTIGTPPYFLSVHFNAPHWPWESSEDEAESRRVGSNITDQDGGTLATYNSMVEAMDRQIGRVLEALDQTGQRDNTIVVFTSDNGGERFSTTWPFTGRKAELLEGGLRIPSVVRWPQRIAPHQTSLQMTMLMDWCPTLLAAAGVQPDPTAPSDGLDLLPMLTRGAPVQDRKLFWRYKANGQRAVREGDFKALKIGDHSFLFNVVTDPMERANLKDRLPEIYHRLTADWDSWNRTMLPEDPKSFTYNNTGETWADHMANPTIDSKAIDDGGPWPSNPVIPKPKT